MAVPLLATKWYIPPAGKRLVERPLLLARLNEFLHPGCRLGLVSAPAGFGKTTIVSVWAAAAKAADADLKVAWLTVEAEDNDPVAFWSYIISALRTQQEGLGSQVLGLLQAVPVSDLEGSLAALVNELARVASPFVLILDDYHLIRHPAIQRTVAFFVEHLPPQIHLLLISRTDPPLPLALLRGRGQLLEIRLNELRFSAEDALAYLNAGTGLNISAQAVRALHERTEGWIAGLQMAAISLREFAASADHSRLEQFVASFSSSNRYILDYLLEEVLNQQPAEIQDFLLRTSILDHLWGPLCDALLIDLHPGHGPASQAILESLEGANLFIVPLDDERCYYRYHRLFADLLRKRLNQLEPALVPQLHRRAALWYEQNGLIPKAVSHALQAKDFSKAAALVNQIVEELWGRGEHATLLGWIDALPEAEKSRYPQLWVFQGSMLITAGRQREAERCVKEIEAYLRSSPEPEARQTFMMGRINSLRAYIASFHGDIPGLLHYATLALDNLTRDEDAGGRCGISLVLSSAYLNRGELEAAARALEDAIEAGKRANRPSMVLTAMANLMIVAYTQGNLRYADQVSREGNVLIQQTGLAESPTAASLFVGDGLILCERHQLSEAEHSIRRGLELARERRYIWGIAWAYRGLLRLRLAQGDLAGAESVIDEAEQFAETHEIPDYHVCGISGLKAWIWIRSGKIDRAERHLLQRGIRDDADLRYPHESEYLALARLHLVKGELGRAGSLLERLFSWAKAANQNLWVIRILALQAVLSQAQGDREKSLQSLGLALDLAQADRCIQTFVDEGQAMRDILSDAARQGLHRDYVLTLLNAFPEVSHPLPAETPVSKTAPALREALSQREIEVVALIADGLTNKEIAQKLHISLRTVKYYTTNLYTKLDVSGRAQAAVRAKELGLLK